jgi:hypothetical protein
MMSNTTNIKFPPKTLLLMENANNQSVSAVAGAATLNRCHGLREAIRCAE